MMDREQSINFAMSTYYSLKVKTHMTYHFLKGWFETIAMHQEELMCLLITDVGGHDLYGPR